jgi:hypothetical protein
MDGGHNSGRGFPLCVSYFIPLLHLPAYVNKPKTLVVGEDYHYQYSCELNC